MGAAVLVLISTHPQMVARQADQFISQTPNKRG
jgi:hypothetical protein